MNVRTVTSPLAAGALLLSAMAVATPAHAAELEDPARGTIKIEETEVTDGETPNEVKVGCDFSIEFFGMAAGEVPVRFLLMPPSGEGTFAERTAVVEEATGSDPSGKLDVDLTEDLRDIEPAVAEDFDYKLKVEAVVKTTSGGNEVTKSAVLFVICPEAARAPQTEVRGAVKKVDKCGRAGDAFRAKRVKGVTYQVKGERIREGVWLKAKTRTVKVQAVASRKRFRVVGQDVRTLRFTNRACPAAPSSLPATGA